MKWIDKIKNVSSVKGNENGLYYCSANKLLNENKDVIIDDLECHSFWFDKNYIFYHDNDGNFRLYKIENKSNKIVDFTPTLNNSNQVFASYNHTFCTDTFKSSYKNALYNLNSNEFILELKNIDNERIIFNIEKIIISFTFDFKFRAYTLPEATPKWQFNIETLGTWLNDKKEEKPYTVDKFIGVWQNQLLASCFSGLIISIDVNNGKLLHQWSAYPSSFTMSGYTVSKINPSCCSMLDEQENKLIGFNHFTLWKIDLQTAKLSAFDLQEQFKVQDLYSIHHIKGFVVNTTHYIISAKTSFKEQLNRRLDCLIAINKETLAIDWKQQFKDNEALKTDIPQYANDKLYHLDWNNTLHIFEKENIDNTIS
ncbi:hypothetical protein [Cytophaga sp. FL35]|uniref:hypothetical protein n=1 Tax=Cytophaga sp. FL35 TaxID=1904456 RepID=UPI001653CEC8|nr:hypothetical protein [Cytophaga sp. FL35]MBC7000282.1 hypothetical protein [Cytophaga sp. FL35]